MKWSSSSNSSISSSGGVDMLNGLRNSSGASSSQNGVLGSNDRRSVFYTDHDIDILKTTNDKISMPTTKTSTTTPSPAVDEMLEIQQRKCENLISFFSAQIQSLNEELENEKQWRDKHLAKIIKALLCFEAKLKNDQKQIKHQLYEKDSKIHLLSKEIDALRKKYSDRNYEPIRLDDVEQFCPCCRKQYYQIDVKNVAVQVSKSELNCKSSDNNNKVIKNTTSSSEDGLREVFAEARRSKRYMSKRTSGSFREYLKTRNMALPECERVPSNDINTTDTIEENLKSKSNETNQSSFNVNELNANEENNSNSSSIEEKARIVANNSLSKRNSVAPKEQQYQHQQQQQQQLETTDDWYASASDMDDSDNAVSKPYSYNAVNPVLECVNQILLQQSMDSIMDNCTNVNKTTVTTNNTSSNNATNNGNNESSPPAKETNSNTLKKRVHFSTQNSMVQVPRSDISTSIHVAPTIEVLSSLRNESTLTSENVRKSNEQLAILNQAGISSNEYEVIGSENNSSNLYVDIESKLSDDDRIRIEKVKTPPALPPKPPNLMKLRQIMKIPMTTLMNKQQVQQQISDNISEPDYCSISDIQESVVKSVQIVADVHKNADESISSEASVETKIEVIPNIDKKIDKLTSRISNVNSSNLKTSSLKRPIKLNNTVDIKSIIHKKIDVVCDKDSNNNSNKIVPKLPMPQKIAATATVKDIPIIRTNENSGKPIEAEFDWYNLDNEYSKLSRNIIERARNNLRTKMDLKKDAGQSKIIENSFGEEYILDNNLQLNPIVDKPHSIAEKPHTRSLLPFIPILMGVESENENEGKSFGCNSTGSGSSNKMPGKYFSKSNQRHGSKQDLTKDKSFDLFLEHTGLTTKPLPQKQKNPL